MLRSTVKIVRRFAGCMKQRGSGHVARAPFRPNTIELVYWQSPLGVNFGDYLSSVIVTKIAADHGYFLDEARPEHRRLLAVGSILHFAKNGDVIWGSGVNGKIAASDHSFTELDVRAVRGPLTAEFLRKKGIATPAVFGDPAILIRDLLSKRFQGNPLRALPVVFVPNLHDLPHMKGWENVVSPLDPWATVIDRISRAQHVVSSSLHGLIVADAFGIPCTYLRMSEEEHLLKYEDYVLGSGRSGLRVTRTREDAISATPMDPPTFQIEALKAAFPFDLWK